MFDVPAHDDPRIMVSIPVPVKGRKPVVLQVPRFDFLDEDQHDALIAAAEEASKDADLPLRRRQLLADLASLKPYVTQAQFKACETLSAGQLQVVMLLWAKGSSVPLGELLASGDSSTENTGAPSSSTSTTEDGQGETSDAA